jgi:hypothetical protein
MNDAEFTKELLQLCQLNLMEENVVDSVSPDKKTTMTAIDWKKRQIISRIVGEVQP